ncbi:MAG: universal stress protein [Nitriliruptoraceae bacterium]
MKRIIVGTDGSEHAQKAVDWAVEQARLQGAALEIVNVYSAINIRDLSLSADAATPAQFDIIRDRIDAVREEADAAMKRLVDQIRADNAGLEVSGVASEDGRPAEALVERSRDADLVVVGSRGRGGFTGLVLGSVSQQVAAHAACPVVIVH